MCTRARVVYGEMNTTTVSAVSRQFLIIFAWFRIPALAQGILSSASVHTNSDPGVIQASHTQSRLAKEAYDESTSPSVSQCKTTPVVTASTHCLGNACDIAIRTAARLRPRREFEHLENDVPPEQKTSSRTQCETRSCASQSHDTAWIYPYPRKLRYV